MRACYTGFSGWGGNHRRIEKGNMFQGFNESAIEYSKRFDSETVWYIGSE